MSGRRLVVTVLALSALFAGSAEPAGAAGKCARAGSTTIAANEVARLYARRAAGDVVRRYYACARRTGRTTWLRPLRDRGLETTTVNAFRLRGRRVGYVRSRFGFREGVEHRITIRDVPTGRLLSSESALMAEAPKADYNGYGVTDLVLGRGAYSAWIVRDVSAPGAPWRVIAHDALGRRLVAEGDIASRSLRRDGTTLRWTQDGEPRNAPFDSGG